MAFLLKPGQWIMSRNIIFVHFLYACCKLASTTKTEKWLPDHRNNRISMSMKMIISGAWWRMVTHSIRFCCGIFLVLQIYDAAWPSICIRTRKAQKMPSDYGIKILEFQKFVTAARKKPRFSTWAGQ
jgi:hypothetical protein